MLKKLSILLLTLSSLPLAAAQNVDPNTLANAFLQQFDSEDNIFGLITNATPQEASIYLRYFIMMNPHFNIGPINNPELLIEALLMRGADPTATGEDLGITEEATEEENQYQTTTRDILLQERANAPIDRRQIINHILTIFYPEGVPNDET